MKDWMSETARRKFPDLGPEWQWVRAEAIKGGSLLMGGIVKINAKGKKVYPKQADMDRVMIDSPEIEATKLAFEAETGKCWACEGEKEEIVGWHVETGARKVPCRRCSATGLKP